MKTIKPMRLSLLTRSFETNRTYYLGVSTLAFFDLESAELLPEVSLWLFAADELGKDSAIDAGIPKSRAEYLVSGSVFTPDGKPQETCPAIARVGTLEKTIYSIGDRFWKGREQSKPQPFSSLPLMWEHAFGGEGYEKNPLGKGASPVETEHGPIQYLPNLELPGKLITKPSQSPDPVGLGPIDITWPQRLSKAGTYDQQWLKELFPGFARDMDWTIHNIASPDQQQAEPFVGIEPFEFVNLHPTKPSVRGKLPGIKSRTFVVQRRDEKEAFVEIPQKLTTIWFFPHAEKGVLIFQGSIVTAEDDASDITHLVLAAEALGQERDVAHYKLALDNRLDKEKGIYYSLKDDDLMPPGSDSGATKDEVQKMTELTKSEGLLQANIKKKIKKQIEDSREVVASHGLDPDVHAPTMPVEQDPPPDDITKLPEYLEKVEEDIKKLKDKQEKFIEERWKELEPVLLQHGIDPEEIRKETEAKPVGPPTFTADGQVAKYRRLADEARAMGTVVDELEDWVTNEEYYQDWLRTEQEIRDSYLVSAHYQGEVPKLDPEASARARDAVLAAYVNNEAFAYKDLGGADLSGLDLRGANFHHGWLESVDFSGSNLEGADFSEAVLARANLSGAQIKGANFRGANLGEANLNGVISGGDIEFSEAILQKADLTRADLHGGRFDNADFTEAVFEATNLNSIRAEGLSFLNTNLSGLSLVDSSLKTTAFIECVLDDVDFSDSTLEGTTFVNCRGSQTKFFRAKTTKLVFAQCGPFANGDYRGGSFKSALFRTTPLRECDFSGAVLDGADLSESDLRGAKFYRAIARDSRFTKADLRDADLTSFNLKGADLQKADIRGTNLTGANLYGANFGRVHSDEATNLQHSNQTKVTIYPLRES